MMKNRKTDSPYEYVPGQALECAYEKDTPADGVDVYSLLASGAYGRVEQGILNALYKYPYLNGKTLYRYLNVLFGSRPDAFYYNLLCKMRRDGVVLALRYGNYLFYTLPDSVRTVLSKRKKFTVTIPERTAAAVLEYASLAQWHISVSEGEKLSKSTLYQSKKIAKETVVVPSYMETVKGNARYRIFSFTLPKEPTQIAKLLSALSDTWRLCGKSKRKGQITLTVLVATTMKELYALHELLAAYPDALGHRVYYVLEGNTSEFSGLSCLYYFSEEEGEYQLHTIDIQ